MRNFQERYKETRIKTAKMQKQFGGPCIKTFLYINEFTEDEMNEPRFAKKLEYMLSDDTAQILGFNMDTNRFTVGFYE